MSYVRRVALVVAACVAGTLLAVAPATAAAAAAAAAAPAAASAPPAAPPAPPTGDAPEWTGTYERVAKDLVRPDGTLRDVYTDWLVSRGRAYRLRLPRGTRLAGGTPVRVRGRLSGQDLEAEQVTPVGAPANVPTTGTTKVLVVLVYWTAPDSMTVTKAKNQVFSDDHGWFGEASYGQLGLSGDATGWHKILAPTGGHCFANHMEIMDRAKAKAKAAGFDPANYGRTMVYFPACGGDAGGAAGWAYQPGNTVWMNGYFDRRVSVHEQGHNYGLPHAHTYSCKSGGVTVTLGGSCVSAEYGDDFDAMGGSDHAAHFSGPQKDRAGWLGTRKRSLTGTKTTFTLAPFEKTAGTTPLAAVVGSGTIATRKYWMEYRQPVGYDNTLPAGATAGVLVRMTDTAFDTSGGPAGPFLLDMSPQNAFDNAVIPAGGAWTSPDGVRISVGTATSTGVSVTVEGGAAPPTAPSVPRNVSATAGDGSVRLAWDPPASNGGATVQSYVVRGTPGNLQTVVEGTTATVGLLQNGTTYAFTVAARNAAGLSPETTPVSAVPDAQLPSVTLTAPAPDTTAAGTVTLRADALPHPVSGAAIDYVSFEVDGEPVGWDDQAPYEAPWDSSQAQDGPHELTATAYDANWRYKTSAPVTVEVRTPRPTISLVTPAKDAVVTADVVELTATAAPAPGGGAELQWVTYELVDGTVVGYAGATAPHQAYWDTSGLNGGYDVVAKVYDADGRVGESAPVHVTIQHPVPSVVLTAPAEGATVKGTVTVTADPRPNADTQRPITSVEFYADTEWVGSAYDAPFSVPWDTTSSTGERVLTAVAYDSDGRRATSPGRTVIVTNPLPSVAVTAPAPGAVVEGSVTFTATAAAHPDSGSAMSRVEFVLDGQPLATVAAPGPYATTWHSGSSFGQHDVVAIAYDTGGRRRTSAPVVFSVKDAAPTGAVTSPANGAVLATGTQTITATGAVDPRTPDRQIALVEFYVDGRQVGYDDTPANGFSTQWDATAGAHEISARVYDDWYAEGTAPPVSVTVAAPPGVPTGVTAVAGADGTAALTWTAPSDTGGQPLLGYVVVGSNGAEWASSTPSATATGLVNGTRYTFRVKARTAAGFGSLSTDSNAVVPGTRTALTAAVSTPTVSYGRAVTVTGTLTRADTGAPLGGRTVQLLACLPATTTCAVVKTATTDPTTGAVSVAYAPKAHRDLRLRYLQSPAGDAFLKVTSDARLVRVRAVLTSAVSKTSVPLGGTVTVSGGVKPAHNLALVYLQRYTSTGWKSIAKKAQSSTGAVSFTGVKPAAKGTFRYRLYFPAHTDHLAGTSAAVSVKVT